MYARSFGSVAELYEANRPPYAEAAVDWVAARLPLHDVLDLAAGTGKLTRQLVEHGARVVAVEPDPEMRAVFSRVLPDVPVLDGSGEAIPLDDEAVDVVAVGQAFHWFDAPVALGEMRRVTRPGGGFALLWNVWSGDDPVLGPISALLDTRRPSIVHERGELDAFERGTFAQRRRLTREQIVGWAASTSGFVNTPAAEQQDLRAQLSALVGADEVDVEIRTDVLVADRV